MNRKFAIGLVIFIALGWFGFCAFEIAFRNLQHSVQMQTHP